MTRETWMAVWTVVAGSVAIVATGAMVMHSGMPQVTYETPLTLPAPPVAAAPAVVDQAEPEVEVDPSVALVKKEYVLPAGKVIARIDAAPEVRAELYQEINPAQARRMQRTPGGMLVRLENGELKSYSMTWGTGYSVQLVAQLLLQISSQEVEVVGQVPILKGDILIQSGAKPEELMKGLEEIMRDDVKAPCKIAYEEVQRPVVVLTGTWKFTPVEGAKSADIMPTVQIYGIKMDANRENGGSAEGTKDNFAKWLGGWIGKQVVIEADGVPTQIRMHYNYDEMQGADTREKARKPENVLKHIEEQTGLKWREESRGVKRLVIEREK